MQKCLLFDRHTTAHVLCRGFLALRPARKLRVARYARRLTEVVRPVGPRENAMRTRLTNMEGGRGIDLTTRAKLLIEIATRVLTPASGAPANGGLRLPCAAQAGYLDTLTAPWKCATLKGTLGRFVDGKVPRGPHNFLAYQGRRMWRRRGRG